jgi:hypothetical protein
MRHLYIHALMRQTNSKIKPPVHPAVRSVQATSYGAYCQKQGHDYTTTTGNWTYNPITNNMWTLIKAPGGPA